MPRRPDSSRSALLLRPRIATAILLLGMVIMVWGVALLEPVFSGVGGALAGVGLGGLYCYANHRHGRRS
jgi:hypothetical protein